MSGRLPPGLEILCEKNAYAYDPRFGYVTAARVGDRWVPTTGSCPLERSPASSGQPGSKRVRRRRTGSLS